MVSGVLVELGVGCMVVVGFLVLLPWMLLLDFVIVLVVWGLKRHMAIW